MPLGQPWLSKPDTKMKTDWGESFKRFSRTLKHESPINGLVEIPLIEIQIIALEVFIRKLLAKQKAEYKKEIYQLYRDEKNHQAWIEKKLKQQYKERLEYIKAYVEGTPAKRVKIDVINKLDQMLQDSDK